MGIRKNLGLGICRVERTQNLNDRGVDLFLFSYDAKIGFQIKSEYDVSEDRFAANVKTSIYRGAFPLFHVLLDPDLCANDAAQIED
jgi:hypothetical protein